MTRHTFEPKVFHNALGLGEPVLTIEEGDTVVTQTLVAWGFDAAGPQPATRPK